MIENHLGFVEHRKEDDIVLKLSTHHPIFDHDWVWRKQRRIVLANNIPRKTGMSIKEIFDLNNSEYIDLLEDIKAIVPKQNDVLTELEDELEDSYLPDKK